MQNFIHLLVFDLEAPTVLIQIFLNMYDKRVTWKSVSGAGSCKYVKQDYISRALAGRKTLLLQFHASSCEFMRVHASYFVNILNSG